MPFARPVSGSSAFRERASVDASVNHFDCPTRFSRSSASSVCKMWVFWELEFELLDVFVRFESNGAPESVSVLHFRFHRELLCELAMTD
jgi:hypothetical protein